MEEERRRKRRRRDEEKSDVLDEIMCQNKKRENYIAWRQPSR